MVFLYGAHCYGTKPAYGTLYGVLYGTSILW